MRTMQTIRTETVGQATTAKRRNVRYKPFVNKLLDTESTEFTEEKNRKMDSRFRGNDKRKF